MSVENSLRLLDRLGHLHRSQLRELAYRAGLNLRQLEVLIYLKSCNRYSNTPMALADYLGLTKGTVSQTIISLEEKLLVRKIVDPYDGRVVHLALTKKAERLITEVESKSVLRAGLARISKHFDRPHEFEGALSTLLIETQRANSNKTFGTCFTCQYFERGVGSASHRCGLTKEPLTEDDSVKICREHDSPEIV